VAGRSAGGVIVAQLRRPPTGTDVTSGERARLPGRYRGCTRSAAHDPRTCGTGRCLHPGGWRSRG
jgi:hypothetical protein